MATNKSSPQIDALLRELATLRAENQHLRSSLPRGRRYSVIVRRAVADAHLIVMTAFSDQPTGALSMERDQGLSRRRWEWGVALLRYAGVIAMGKKDWRSGLTWLATDLNNAIMLLEEAAKALDVPEGYKRLRSVLQRRQGAG